MTGRSLGLALISGTATTAAAVAVWLATGSGAPAHDPVAAGGDLYARHCASCHESQQGIGPELNRAVVASYGSLERLADYVRVTMPYGAPGTLSEREYQEVAKYLLRSRLE